MTTVKFGAKNMFFDRKLVEQLIGKQAARALGRCGAFVRTKARSLLRRRKAVSAPGSPPSVHSKDQFASLKNIWFALDRSTLQMIVGPVRLNVYSLTREGSGPGAQNVFTQGAVPGVLEHGGLIGVRKIKGPDGKWERVPFGQRRHAEMLIPVWKATPEQKAASVGVYTIRKGHSRISKKGKITHASNTMNFYRIVNPPSRHFWTNIAPRPFMQPALEAEAPKFPSLWLKAG